MEGFLMLQCTSCGRQQQSGKFCGSCGSALEEVNEEIEASDTNRSVQEKMESKKIHEEAEVGNVSVEEHIEGQEAAAVAQSTITEELQPGHDLQGELKRYWQYSLALLKNPGKAFTHGEDKFKYGIVNLILYAITFSLIMLSLARGAYKNTFGGFGSAFNVDTTGVFTQLTVYSLIGMCISLAIVLLCLLIVEKIMIKRMSFKEILVQYSGLLIPFVFLQVGTLLFSFIGSSIIALIMVYISLFYSLFYLTGLFIYEKLSLYQITENKVYKAIGTTIFVVIAFMIITLVFGMSFMERFLGMIDEVLYYL